MSPDRILLARYQLSVAIRERRSTVGELVNMLRAQGEHDRVDFSDEAKLRLLAVAIPYLGRWSAKRIVTARSQFIDETAPLFEMMMDLSSAEVQRLVTRSAL